jgi:hypothetical protein
VSAPVPTDPITAQIENPWVIVHQPGGDKATRETIIFGPGRNYEQFASVLCDIVRGVAIGFEVKEEAVWDCVRRERLRPACDLQRRHQFHEVKP